MSMVDITAAYVTALTEQRRGWHKAQYGEAVPVPIPEPIPERKVIELLGPVQSRAWPGILRIQVTVAMHFNIPHLALVSHRRTKDLIFARFIAVWLARKLIGKTLKQIGNAFSDRDHTTILSAIQRVDGWMGADPHVAELLAYFIELLTPPEAA